MRREAIRSIRPGSCRHDRRGTPTCNAGPSVTIRSGPSKSLPHAEPELPQRLGVTPARGRGMLLNTNRDMEIAVFSLTAATL